MTFRRFGVKKLRPGETVPCGYCETAISQPVFRTSKLPGEPHICGQCYKTRDKQKAKP